MDVEKEKKQLVDNYVVALSWVAGLKRGKKDKQQKVANELVVMENPFRRVVVVKDTDYDTQSGVWLGFSVSEK